MIRRLAVLVSSLVVLVAPACRGGTGARPSEGGLEGTITVAASSALKASLTSLGRAFREEHPRTTIRFDFDDPSGLADELADDPAADVVAIEESAAVQLKLSRHTVFARDPLALAVAVGNSLGIASLTDLARPDVKVALCASDVPCGAATARVLSVAGLPAPPHASSEPDGEGVVSKVVSGDADAGLAYATDIAAQGQRLARVEIPAEQNVPNPYAVGRLGSSKNPDLAQAFISFILSGKGQQLLRAAGFATP